MHKEVQVLNIKRLSLSLMVLLSACSVTQPPAYQKDRAPEFRDQYNGVEGMSQYQEDKAYLMKKELVDKCTDAKIALAIAEADNNQGEVKTQNNIINRACTK